MCLYPKLMKNRKYTETKKNGGNVPTPTDPRTLLVPVGCGKCMECKKQKGRAWAVRLQEDIRIKQDVTFVTLTFSNESIKELYQAVMEEREGEEITGYDLDNAIAKKGTRRFLERWRKQTGKSIKHWLVTELGHQGTENIHLHGLIYSADRQMIEKTWAYGYVFCGTYVNEQTINYMCKYVMKMDENHKEYSPRILSSAGIGTKYTERLDAKNNKYKGDKTREYYTTRQGIKLNIPIYYRNKIYTEEEREKLWIKKLDENIRYVDGIKIDLNREGTERYYKVLKEARKKNKKMGYGDDQVNWKRKEYEEQRRALNMEQRLNNNAQALAYASLR